MPLSPFESLNENQIKSGINFFILDGIMSQAMVTLTSGIFLVAFALQLGANNFIIGLLASIPPLTQLAQIPAVYIIEKFRNRRLICVLSSFLTRLCILLIVAIPFLINTITGVVGIFILLSFLFLQNLIGSTGGAAWNSWIRDLIPQNILGASYSKRMIIALALSSPFSIMGGIIIDTWGNNQNSLISYAIIYSFALLFGMIGLIFLSRIPEPLMPINKEKMPILQLLKEPFNDQNYRKLMVFLFTWTFAINIASPFFTVYLIQGLGYGTLAVILLSLISLFFNLLFLRIWGRISDRFTNKAVLTFNGFLFILMVFLWTFTTLPNKYVLTFPLLIVIHILSGISNAGIVLSTLNIANKLSPHGHATSYIAAYNFVSSIAAGIDPLFVGLLDDFLIQAKFSIVILWNSPGSDIAQSVLSFEHWDFLFVIAVIIGIYALHRLSLVQEVGEMSENLNVFQMISEVRRELRNLSSIGGLNQMNTFTIPPEPTNQDPNENTILE